MKWINYLISLVVLVWTIMIGSLLHTAYQEGSLFIVLAYTMSCIGIGFGICHLLYDNAKPNL